MRINIDVNQSIRRGRLKVIHKNFWHRIAGIFYVLFVSFFVLFGLGLPISMTVQSISQDQELAEIISLLVIFSPFIFLGFLTLYALVNDNRLKRFKGRDEEFNHKMILEILERRFKVSINKASGKTMRIYKKATCWKSGIRVIVIFDNQDILINISRFNYEGVKSPFHPWFDGLKIRSIRRDFNKVAKKAA